MQGLSKSGPTVAGPDLNTRAPKVRFPEKACDCHAHVFGPQTKYPYLSERRFTPHDASLLDYQRTLASLGVTRGVLIQPSHYGTDNSALVDALKEAGDSLRGIASVEDAATNAELIRLHHAGVRGVRINLRTSKQSALDIVRSKASRITSLGWHLELCISSREYVALERIVNLLPCHIVVDHIGQVSLEDGIQSADFLALGRMAETGRCWIKLSAPMRMSKQEYPYCDVAPFVEVLLHSVPEQLLWGTDWPHPNIRQRMPNDAELADLLVNWVPHEGIRRTILVENPDKLYWYD